MKKIKQIPLCAALLASTAFLCCESPVNEALDTGASAVCASCLLSGLMSQQASEKKEPALTVESNRQPLVGSALAGFIQCAADSAPSGSGGTAAQQNSSEPSGSGSTTARQAGSDPAQQNSSDPFGSIGTAARQDSSDDSGSVHTDVLQSRARNASQYDKESDPDSGEFTTKKEKKKKNKKKKKEESAFTEYVLPPKLGLRKSLESHTAITSRNSAQYRLQQAASTDRLGLRRYQKRYMVAVGTYFHAPVGTRIDVHLSKGSTLKCVVGDIKADSDTIGGLTQKNDGSVVEFIVEWRQIERSCKRLGSMHALEEFDGYVEKVIVYEEP